VSLCVRHMKIGVK
jgi:hypothetical protein